ncbi:MAG: hypothetical protein LBS19_16095, partial [Clostridiales bacterium]|nr:hypothetical protein [Clostridiales bacterium]
MAALIYIMLIEAVHRNSFKSACLWIKERPGDYALNALLFIALEGLFTAASGAFFTGGCIAAVLCLTLAAVGFFKRAARNEPLYFSDIFLAFKVMGVAGASNIIMTPRILISLAAGTVIEAGISFLPLPDINTSARVVIGVVSLFVILMLTIKKSDDFTYRRKGFLRGFVLN